MTNDIKAKIAQMQTKRTPWPKDIRRNDNGTYSHRFDAKRQWTDRSDCAVDLRFTRNHLKAAGRGHQLG